MQYRPNPPHGKQVKESRYYTLMEIAILFDLL